MKIRKKKVIIRGLCDSYKCSLIISYWSRDSRDVMQRPTYMYFRGIPDTHDITGSKLVVSYFASAV